MQQSDLSTYAPRIPIPLRARPEGQAQGLKRVARHHRSIEPTGHAGSEIQQSSLAFANIPVASLNPD